MGLAWQQGPLATRSVGRFLVAEPLPERMLFAEPLRRRMRVRFGGRWVADSEDVVLLPILSVTAGARVAMWITGGALWWYVVPMWSRIRHSGNHRI